MYRPHNSRWLSVSAARQARRAIGTNGESISDELSEIYIHTRTRRDTTRRERESEDAINDVRLRYARAKCVWKIFVNTCVPPFANCAPRLRKDVFNAPSTRITCIYYAERCSLFWDNCELCPRIVENGELSTMYAPFSLSLYVFPFFLSPFRKVASRMRGKWGCISEFRNSNREEFIITNFS